MLKRCLAIMLCLWLASEVLAEDISPKDTVFLEYSTLINYNGTSVGTVFVEVKHGALKYMVPLQDDGEGEWSGAIWLPDSLPGGVPTGNWNRKYFWAYAGDTTKEDYPFGVRDTSELQGAAVAGLSKEEIAHEAYCSLYVHRDDFKDGGGAGSGANQVIVRCKSSTDSSSIPGASVAVWNADQTARPGLLGTDTDSGKAVFALDNGTYNLRIQKYKFQWTVPITIGVSGDKDTTIYATEFTPSPPPTVDHCVVYGYIDSLGLVGTRAKISCDILYYTNLKIGTKLLAYGSYRKTVYTNASGYWEMPLYPNEDITPAGTQYEFRVTSPNMPTQVVTVTVPELASWELVW